MIEFQLDTASGVATYLQLVQQVHQALQLGILEPGDQLPTAQQVVAKLAINPNTVLKAYRDLEREGLVRAATGQWARSLSRDRSPGTDPATLNRFLATVDRLAADRHAPRASVPMTSRRSTAPAFATSSRRVWHDDRHRDERARQAVRTKVGAPGLHPDHPRRQGGRARRSERRGQDHAAATGDGPACSEPRGQSRCSAGDPTTVLPSSTRWASSPRTRRPTPDYRSPSTSAWARISTRTGTSELAEGRIDQLGLDPRQKAGSLSGGQRAQLALTLAVAKRPELLLLDEPVASLDPLARREFLQGLMEIVAKHGVSVVLSSHLIADLERVCDYLVILVSSHVRLAGEVTDLLAAHHRLSGPRRDPSSLPANQEVIERATPTSRAPFSCARASRSSIRHGA